MELVENINYFQYVLRPEAGLKRIFLMFSWAEFGKL